MWKIILIGLAVIAALYIAWVGGQSAYNTTLGTQTISPGDITISQVSNSSVDWVALHNNLDSDVDLNRFVFTDGDNIFTFPPDSIVPSGGDLLIAADKDEGDIEAPVDLYWGDWGLGEDGELILLINDTGDMVVDFVFAQSLEDGELLERIPSGTGALMDPVKSQPMQMQRPSYRAVPTESIESLGQDFSTSVISFGGLLTGIATFVINLDQARDVLGRIGLFRGRKKGGNG